MNSLKPQGIDDVLKYLTSEYSNGNLTNNNIQDYVNQLRQTIKDNSNNPNFVNEMRCLYKQASELVSDIEGEEKK